MIAGIRTDIGIKIHGDDLEALREKAAEVGAVVERLRGSSDVYVEQITGQPVLEMRVDQAAVARYGVSARHALEVVAALGGTKLGEVRRTGDGSISSSASPTATGTTPSPFGAS